VLHLEHRFYGDKTWTLLILHEKYMESFEMWCWLMMEKISYTSHVRNEEVVTRQSQGEKE
jgi:hypothetical protein